MKKIIKSKIFLVIITTLIVSSISIYATNSYNSNSILYTTSDGESMTVSNALNELYESNSNNELEFNELNYSNSNKANNRSGTINVSGYKYIFLSSIYISNSDASKSSSGKCTFGEFKSNFSRNTYSGTICMAGKIIEITSDTIAWSYSSSDEERISISYHLIK